LVSEVVYWMVSESREKTLVFLLYLIPGQCGRSLGVLGSFTVTNTWSISTYKEEQVHCDSHFQKFQFAVSCFGACGKAAHHRRSMWGRKLPTSWHQEAKRERRSRVQIASSRPQPQWPNLFPSDPFSYRFLHLPIAPQAEDQAFSMWAFGRIFKAQTVTLDKAVAPPAQHLQPGNSGSSIPSRGSSQIQSGHSEARNSPLLRWPGLSVDGLMYSET
jgi:hypothetical protein